MNSGRQNEATTHLLFIHPNASTLVKLGFCGRDDAPKSKIKDHKQYWRGTWVHQPVALLASPTGGQQADKELESLGIMHMSPLEN